MDWRKFWEGYAKTTGKLTWRLARGNDYAAIRRLRNISERFLKHPQRSLSPFKTPVLLTLVAENEKGKIVDALMVEAQVEIIKTACTANGFEESAGLAEDLSNWLHALGFKRVIVGAPPRLADKMADLLMRLGFRSQAQRIDYFTRPI